MSKELKYENDTSQNKAPHYRNINYVYFKKKIEILDLENTIIIKISLEGPYSRCELTEESGNMKKS